MAETGTVEKTNTVIKVRDDQSLPRAVVTRNLHGDRDYDPGEVIEMPDRRRREVLERDRRLRSLERGEELWACGCGRLWAGKERAEAHC